MIITLNIPSGITNAAVEAMCWKYGYETLVFDPESSPSMIPNDESKADFAKRTVVELIRKAYVEHQESLYVAEKTATVNAAETAAANIVGS